jgi:hypothetical protein
MRDPLADVDHVLVRSASHGAGGVVHLPDDDDPDWPGCRVGEDSDGPFWTVDVEEIPDEWRLCRNCDPEYVITPDQPDESLVNKLADPDFGPEDVPGLDGGQA